MTERDADGLDDARALLPGRDLVAREVLADGERSTVLRVEATDRDGGHQGLIVKRYHADDEGWRREAAALASVPGSVRVPALVAVGSSPQILVTEDLGDGPSVATALLGDDPRAAEQAVVGWAEALAELHPPPATPASSSARPSTPAPSRTSWPSRPCRPSFGPRSGTWTGSAARWG